MATITQIAKEVARQNGEQYNNIDVRANFDNWTLEVIQEIFSDAAWPFLKQTQTITTVASQENYVLAAGTGEITSIRRSTNFVRELNLTSKEKLIEDDKDMSITAEPEWWYENGMSGTQRQIGLYPLPSASSVNYDVRFVFDPEGLTRTSTFPAPLDLLPLVRHGVRKLYKESILDFNGAQLAAQAAAGSWARLKSKYLQPRSKTLRFRNADIPPEPQVSFLRFPDEIS